MPILISTDVIKIQSRYEEKSFVQNTATIFSTSLHVLYSRIYIFIAYNFDQTIAHNIGKNRRMVNARLIASSSSSSVKLERPPPCIRRRWNAIPDAKTLQLPVIARQLCLSGMNWKAGHDEDSCNRQPRGRGAARYSKIVFGYDDFKRCYARLVDGVLRKRNLNTVLTPPPWWIRGERATTSLFFM